MRKPRRTKPQTVTFPSFLFSAWASSTPAGSSGSGRQKEQNDGARLAPAHTAHSKTGAAARAKRSPAPAPAPGHGQPDTPAAEVAVKFRAGVLENFSQKERAGENPLGKDFPSLVSPRPPPRTQSSVRRLKGRVFQLGNSTGLILNRGRPEAFQRFRINGAVSSRPKKVRRKP